MNSNSAFLISRFSNPSGATAFRVSGWLDGVRIRRNFVTQVEARAEVRIVHLDEKVIIVQTEVSKVHEKRAIVIQPNLAEWLTAYPLDKFPIVPPNLQHTRAFVAAKFALSKDVMRHTFISMFVGQYRSIERGAPIVNSTCNGLAPFD